MILEPTPIEHFIARQYRTPMVQKLMESTNAESERVISHIADHFREMGIYSVEAVSEQVVKDAMLHQLKIVIQKLQVIEDKRREMVERRNRRFGA